MSGFLRTYYNPLQFRGIIRWSSWVNVAMSTNSREGNSAKPEFVTLPHLDTSPDGHTTVVKKNKVKQNI